MKKSCLLLYVIICLIVFVGCGEVGEYSAKEIADEIVNTPINELVSDSASGSSNANVQSEKTSDDNGDVDTSEYANDKKRYKVGDTFIYCGCEYVINETRVCEDDDGKSYVEVLYSVKNVSDGDVRVSTWDFCAYADDYAVDIEHISLDPRKTSGTISKGRKLDTFLKIFVDPKIAKRIELEPAESNKVIDLQDVDKGIFIGGINGEYSSTNDNIDESRNDYSEKANSKDGMMDYSGHYEGRNFSVDFYINADADGDEIGTVDLFYQGSYISSEPVYIVSDMGSWSGSGYDAFYAIYTEEGPTYLAFYEMSGVVYMDYNSDSETYDSLEMIGHF